MSTTTTHDDPEMRWLLSAGYQLPDGRECTLTYMCVTIADTIGMRFRSVPVESLEYPGHLQDAAVTLWLAVTASQKDGAALLRNALRMAMRDPAVAIEAALEWWQAWFADNRWHSNSREHYEAIAAAQQMWGDIMSSETRPITEGGGEGAGSSLGK